MRVRMVMTQIFLAIFEFYRSCVLHQLKKSDCHNRHLSQPSTFCGGDAAEIMHSYWNSLY